MAMECISAAYLTPAFNALTHAGVGMERYLSQSPLSAFRLDDPQALSPQYCIAELVEDVVATQGAEVVGHLMQSYRMENVPGWGEAITSTGDILEAISLAGSNAARILSDNRVTLRIEGATAIFEDTYLTGTAGGSAWKSMFSLPLAIDGFRAACGPEWLPFRIDLAFDDAKLIEEMYDLSGVDVRTAQPINRLHFSLATLAQKMSRPSVEDAPIPIVPERDRDRLMNVFDSLERMEHLNISSVSQMFDLSPRSLQRALRAEGITFSDALDHWRLTRAVVLLDDPGLTVIEISQRLGYRHASHFIRAFRRWTGTTPQTYRDR